MGIYSVVRINDGNIQRLFMLVSEFPQYLLDNPINQREIICIKSEEVDL